MEVVKVDPSGEREVTFRKPKGKLLIIGGADRREEGIHVLETLAGEIRRKRKPLLLVTAATVSPGDSPHEYRKIFKELGVHEVEVLEIPDRDAGYEEANVEKVVNACCIFFTGGDQLRITSQIGDTPVYRKISQLYADGCIVAGTSAGAAAMPHTMIIGGPGDESNRISTLSMAPGLGLLDSVVIDSHFAERGRIGRLLGAVVQNPRNLGIGLDESTGILVDRGERFSVIGPGAVYIVDGTDISHSGLSEETPEGIITIHDVRLHVLGEGDEFDLIQRRPIVKNNGNHVKHK